MKFLSPLDIDGYVSLITQNPGVTPTKFLIQDSQGKVAFRTGQELKLDIGADSVSKIDHYVKLGETMSIGTPVYVSGSTGNSGTNMIVLKASNLTEATSSKTMGLLLQGGVTNDIVKIITEGLHVGVDTSTAVAGDPVWLGPNGTLLFGLANKPYASKHLVFLGIVTRAQQNNGEIFVKVQNGFELDELHDVDLKTTTPVNGHILGFNGTLWVNKTIAGWLGYTPQAQLSGTGFVKISGTTISYDNTSYYPSSNPNNYISSYTETDTLATVTARGATTSYGVGFNNYVNILGGNSLYWYNSGNGWYVSSYFDGTNLNFSQSLNITGRVVSSVDMRSPIYYDSNNTSYYLDPAGNSSLYYASFANDVQMNGNYLRFDQSGTRSWNVRASGGNLNFNSGDGGGNYVFNGASSFSGNASWFGGYGSGSGPGLAFENQTTFARMAFWGLDFYEWDAGHVMTINNGYVSADNSFRAPVFYDSNNTGYYVDPASTSSVNAISAGGYIYSGNYIESAGAVYGTIFYDNNNRAYYCDPSSTSNFVGLTVANTISGNISGNAGGGSAYSRCFPTNYVGGQQTNPQVYFNYLQGLNVAMTGAWSVWSDTLWINGYSGGDVPYMCALHFLRNGQPRMAISVQTREATSYGSFYEVVTEWSNDQVKSGYFQSNSSLRAPIFYDSNDTTYYGDFASTSNLYGLQITGASHKYLYINPGTGYEAMVRVQGGTGSSWYSGKRTTSTTQAGTDGFHFYSDAAGDTVVGFGTDGTIKAKGDVVAYASSDRQLKNNITPIENALEKVKQIGGYTFNWNDKQTIYEGHDVGVIAQEIEAVLPEVVTTRDTGFKAVKYEKIVPLLIEAIKEQQKQIEELKQLVNQLIQK